VRISSSFVWTVASFVLLHRWDQANVAMVRSLPHWGQFTRSLANLRLGNSVRPGIWSVIWTVGTSVIWTVGTSVIWTYVVGTSVTVIWTYVVGTPVIGAVNWTVGVVIWTVIWTGTLVVWTSSVIGIPVVVTWWVRLYNHPMHSQRLVERVVKPLFRPFQRIK